MLRCSISPSYNEQAMVTASGMVFVRGEEFLTIYGRLSINTPGSAAPSRIILKHRWRVIIQTL